jgi:hypothetical protein
MKVELYIALYFQTFENHNSTKKYLKKIRGS